MSHRAVAPRPDFPRLEEEVLERWRERDVCGESIRRREGAPVWVFYEGPPTANGRPGSHHVLSRVFKDIFPRYKTMCGYSVERKGGWDCHGLPVEIEVEKQLGIASKEDIERYGIAEFNQRCRRSEEHTSELQSQSNLVCRLLLEKKKTSMTALPHRSASDTSSLLYPYTHYVISTLQS